MLTTKFPAETPDDWGRSVFETVIWFFHLASGGVWIGGLIGLLALAAPGAVPAGRRGEFWSPAIRRFSISAMSCVGATILSGLFLYWEHVDGPRQLFTAMYGRVLGVKILIVGTMVLLGTANQFWLHPRIETLRAAGDTRPLRLILLREFPVTVALEVLLGLSVLMVAPFLHGWPATRPSRPRPQRPPRPARRPRTCPRRRPRPPRPQPGPTAQPKRCWSSW